MRRLLCIAALALGAQALADDRPPGMLSGAWDVQPETGPGSGVGQDVADTVAFDETNQHVPTAPRTSVYVRIAGGFVSAQHHGDFDPAAYPPVSPFFPPLGLLGPEYVQSDIGFAAGGAVGLRIPWSRNATSRGSTRIEAEYMFRTYTLDEVVYDEEFGVRPEADITGRVTSHAVMGNVIAEWNPHPHWRFGVGGGAGVLFSDLKANGEEGDGSAFAAQVLLTGQYRLTDTVWLTFGGRVLGATEVTYNTDIEEASTIAGDLTVGLSLEI